MRKLIHHFVTVLKFEQQIEGLERFETFDWIMGKEPKDRI